MFKKWLFKKYKQEFTDYLTEDLIGQSPDSINAPVFEILEAHKMTFQRWLVWNAWFVQKKLVNDENPEFLRGVLSHIRVLMALANKGKTPIKSEIPTIEEKKDPKKGVEAFLKGMEEGIKKA